MALMDRLKHAWNTFKNKDPTQYGYTIGPSYGRRPDRERAGRGQLYLEGRNEGRPGR